MMTAYPKFKWLVPPSRFASVLETQVRRTGDSHHGSHTSFLVWVFPGADAEARRGLKNSLLGVIPPRKPQEGGMQ